MVFQRLSEGKLFAVEARQYGRVEYFWLCDTCAPSLALAFDPTKGVVVSPIPVKPAERRLMTTALGYPDHARAACHDKAGL